jgi:hypothetical protein
LAVIHFLFDADDVLHEAVLCLSGQIVLLGHVVFDDDNGIMGSFKSFPSFGFDSL